MSTKHPKSSAAIRAQIKTMQAALAVAEEAERAKARDELIATVERAQCMPEALAWAHQQLAARKVRHVAAQ